jgi:hypothetical protein
MKMALKLDDHLSTFYELPHPWPLDGWSLALYTGNVCAFLYHHELAFCLISRLRWKLRNVLALGVKTRCI